MIAVGNKHAYDVLVLSPLQRDLALATEVLAQAGFRAKGFSTITSLIDVLNSDGAGMLLIAIEALAVHDTMARLFAALDDQPPWSDLPVSIITHPRISDRQELRALRRLERLHSATFLDRPVRIASLISTTRAALQARKRQYQVHVLLTTAEEDVRRRDEFLAMLSHELRNPLSAISNAIHFIQLEPERGVGVAQMLQRQIQHLTRMVDDLLDVARITSGKIDLKKTVIDLAAIVDAAVETVGAYIRTQQHHLDVVKPPWPVYVEGDPARLTQVVGNLLHNAAKYTEKRGRIEITLEQHQEEAVLRVRDTGIGLDHAHRDRLFDLFAQGSRGIDRSQGGMGVGLTIVRRLVQMHDGSVSAASDGLGRGSVFCVRLPLLQPAPDVGETTARATAHARSRRVLVVDDNEDIGDGLGLLIEALGHDVRVVYDGRDALRAVQDCPPDVIFLDVGMPGMDGFEVARALRGSPDRERMVVVAVTGYGDEATVRNSLAAGFDLHLLKPAELQSLQKILSAGADARARATIQ